MDPLWMILVAIAVLLIVLLLVVVPLALRLSRSAKGEKTRKTPSHAPFNLPPLLLDKGEKGEYYIARLLESCKIYGDKLINHVIVENPENGMTAEIDHILFSTRGIFVVETKNLSGDIYGSDTLSNWKQYLGNGETIHKLPSPVRQNNTHIYVLKKVLKTKAWLENIVVFAQGNTQFIKSEFVYTPQQLYHYLNGKTERLVSERERDRLYNILLSYKENPVVSEEQHNKNIKIQQARIASNLCPRCNGSLVLQHGIHGAFYGCSNYPNCTFTKEI